MPSATNIPAMLKRLNQVALEGVHTAVPGVVTSYDAATQTADVQPICRVRIQNVATGAVSYEQLPVIPAVPVAWPSAAAGAQALTMALAEGDTVLLVFAECSLDEWEVTGETDVEPIDPRRFDYTDAIAYPGTRSPADPLASTAYASGAVVLSGADVRLGGSGATDAVALASLTEAMFGFIDTVITSWVPVPGDGGAALKTAWTVAASGIGGFPSSVGASKVTAE